MANSAPRPISNCVNSPRYRIGLTQGDPKGIGPEIVAAAVEHYRNDPDVELVVYGETSLRSPHSIDDSTAGRLSASYVAHAVADAVAGTIDAIVTAPIHKGRWRAAGITAPGHTEYLAQCVSATQPPATRMLFWTDAVRVAFVTTHISLRAVPAAITPAALRTTIMMTRDFLRRYADCPAPRLACLGLNPHAGENGLLGAEERETIIPTLERLRTEGFHIDGPFPADSYFAHHASRGTHHAVIAMYHDQGLIPIKTLDPHGAVNVTMGLPFLRTSVGHGTADDIAGTGRADPASVFAAIETARRLFAK